MNIIDLPELTALGLNIIKPNSRVCLLLDYPSENDIKERKPLSDSAGAILSISLSQAGLTLAECSVVYVIPDTRTLATLYDVWTPKHGFTTLGNSYIEIVKDTLVTINPNVVITVGEISLQAVTSKRSITKWRGSILESSIRLNQKVVPTLAARDCAKMYIWRYFMASDVKKAAGEAFTPAINLPQRNLHIEPSFQEAMCYMMMIKMKDIRRIAVDIECIKGQPQKGITCISLAISPIDCMSIPFDNRWTEMEELELWKMLAELLEDPLIEKVYQNGADFDIVYLLMVHNIFNYGYIHDTMIKHALNYPDFPKSLAFLTSIYTNEPYYKDDGKEGKVGNGQQREFFIYNAKDSAVDYEINDKVSTELVKYGNQQTYDFLTKLMEPLLYMQLRGVRINQEGIASLKIDAEKQIIESQKQLDFIIGDKLPLSTKAQRKSYEYERLNPNSNKQCQEYFYGTLKLKVQTSTKKDPKTGEHTSKVTTDTKAMGRLARMYRCEEALLVKKIRGIRKLKGTYLEMNIDKDGRLRCCFRIAGTVTGRLSSSETIFGTGSNMQNLPLTFKEFLIPDDGYIFCDLDKAQAEWVASAYIFNDANMIQAVEDKADIHIRTGAMMFKAPEDRIKIEDKYLGGSTDELWIAEQRQKLLEDTGHNVLQYNPLPNMSMRQSGKKCLTPETEVLTERGWVCIQNITVQEKVAQWDNGEISFVYPSAVIAYPYEGKMYNLSANHLDQNVTPDHRIPVKQDRALRTLFVVSADKLNTNLTHHHIPTSGLYRKITTMQSLFTSLEIQLLVAVQADGTVDNYGNITIRVVKQRKIDRLRDILIANDLRYTETNGSFHIHKSNFLVMKLVTFLGKAKNFGGYLLGCSYTALVTFLKELPLWDGYSEDNKYFSTNKNNIEWVQTIAHLTGNRSTFKTIEPKGYGNKLLYLTMIGKAEGTSLVSVKKQEFQYNGMVYCLTVPASYFIIRSNEKISVTGNCNHSFNYGLSPNGFSIQYDMPLPFSRRCHSLYHSGYPGIHLGHKTIERELTNTRTLVNLFGRKRRFLGRMDDNLFKAAYSYKPQSTVGELLNRGIVTTYYDQYSPEHAEYMRPQEILNQVHDNLLFQYPIRTEEEVINFTHCILRTAKNLNIPLTANGRTFVIRTDGKVGFNGKKMEKIDIENGFDACLESVKKAITKLREQPTTKPIELINELVKDMEDFEDSENEITEK
jgi:DNA polymerase I-like protein with 3'-5' exonuclease and polymerase domains/uracil-DNA glycosylase